MRIFLVLVVEGLFFFLVGLVGLIGTSLWFADWFPPPPWNDFRVLTAAIVLVSLGVDTALLLGSGAVCRRLLGRSGVLPFLSIVNGLVILLTVSPTLLVLVLAVVSGHKP